MIRVRIGDVIKSNYSRFGLARLFGLGQSPDVFNIDQPTETSSQQSGPDPAEVERIYSAEIAKRRYPWVATEGPDGVLGLRADLSAAAAGNPTGYQVGDNVIFSPPSDFRVTPLDSDGNPAERPRSSRTREGRRNWGRVLQGVVVEVLDRVQVRPPRRGSSTLSQVDFFTQEDLDSSGLILADPTNLAWAILARYKVRLSAANAGAVSLEGQDPGQQGIEFLISHSHITGLSRADQATVRGEALELARGNQSPGSNQASQEVQTEGAQRLKDFLTPANNPIVRSFESTRGRGLAGFITDLSFDNSESMWETSPGSRAPIMLKASVTFKPIHDIPMGMDSDGAMRSVAYNVGSYSRDIGQDPFVAPLEPSDASDNITPVGNAQAINNDDVENIGALGGN